MPGGIGPAPPGATIPGGRLADGERKRGSRGNITLYRGENAGASLLNRRGIQDKGYGNGDPRELVSN